MHPDEKQNYVREEHSYPLVVGLTPYVDVVHIEQELFINIEFSHQIVITIIIYSEITLSAITWEPLYRL